MHAYIHFKSVSVIRQHDCYTGVNISQYYITRYGSQMIYVCISIYVYYTAIDGI